MSIPPEARARVEALMGTLEEASPHELPQEEFLTYACTDPVATSGIYTVLEKLVTASGLGKICAIDHAIIPMVADMMSHGMRIDTSHFYILQGALTEWMVEQRAKLNDWLTAHTRAGIENVGSDDQVADLLFQALKLPYLYLTDSGKRPSVDAETLETLKYTHPVAGMVLEWRELETLQTTFVTPLLKRALAAPDGRIHPNILLTRQPTGRLSTKEPNLLAMPVRTALGRLVREGFIPTPGYSFLSVDFSQLEARILAHLSGDDHLCEIFNTGQDPFRIMAAEWRGCKPDEIDNEMRYVTKHNFYGIQNGLTAEGLSIRLRSEGLSQWTIERTREFMNGFFSLYPGIAQAISRWHAEARATGMVRDMFGRYRFIPQVRSTKKRVREQGLRQAQNFNMPSTAAAIMKLAMKGVWDELKQFPEQVWAVLQIHDELLLEVPQGMEKWWGGRIASIMESAYKLHVPLKAKFAWSSTSWGAIEK